MVSGFCGWVTGTCGRTTASARTRIALTRVPAVRGGLNLRRRGWAVGRPGRKFCGARGCSCDSFAFPADASVLAIFQNYTMFVEFLADSVGGGEGAAVAGGLAVAVLFFGLFVEEGVCA